RRNRLSDILRLVRAMDAIQRILAAGVKVHRARTHRITRTAFDIVRKRAEPAFLIRSRGPTRPFFLAADRGHARPRLTILAYDCAIRPSARRCFSTSSTCAAAAAGRTLYTSKSTRATVFFCFGQAMPLNHRGWNVSGGML